MTGATHHDFTDNLLRLLAETFEGPRENASFYLEKGAGLFPTLASMTSDAASRPSFPGAPTVAAHCVHVTYYLRVVHNSIVDRGEQVDWPSSWQLQCVEPEEWATVQSDMRSAYEALKQTIDSMNMWDRGAAGDSLAILAHSAYHLGAIRQLLRAVQPQVQA